MDTRFINNTPIDNLMNNLEDNPYLEVDTILSKLETDVRGEPIERPVQENDTSIKDSIEKVGE